MEPVRLTVPTPELAEAVADVPGLETAVWDLRGPAPWNEIDVVVIPYLTGPQVLHALEGLTVGLVQGQSIGYDGVAQHLPPGLVFANAASVHESATAELAVGLMIAAQRGLDDFVRDATSHRWRREWYPGLADRRVLLVGYGGVGRAIAQRLEPFEVEVRAIARRAREVDGRPVSGWGDLARELARADIVALAVPLTPATTRLVDDDFLAAIPDAGLVVNVARGAVADTDALVRATPRLRLALDVVDPEPLPPEHPLWERPGVLLTPHVGGATGAMAPRIAALVREQVARRESGDEPRNVVLRS